MGKGYNDNDQLCQSSLSQHLMQQVLQPNLVLIFSSPYPHVRLMVSMTSSIYSIDTLLYPYALPSIQFPYSFSRLCLSCNLSSSLRSLHLVKRRRAHLAREVQQDRPTNETRQHYLSGRQNEFKKNRRYRGIIRMIRISTDQ